MVKKIVLAASAAAVVLGAGTVALAASGSSSASPSAPSSSVKSAAPASPGDQGRSGPPQSATGKPRAEGRGKGHRPVLRALGRSLHAQWVTRDRNDSGAFVTHNAIRGAVTAVSATSITVKAADGFSQTYAVTETTKVRLRKGQPDKQQPGSEQPGNEQPGDEQPGNEQPGNGNRGGAPGTIGDVHTGDKVVVIGTGTTSLTADHIVAATK